MAADVTLRADVVDARFLEPCATSGDRVETAAMTLDARRPCRRPRICVHVGVDVDQLGPARALRSIGCGQDDLAAGIGRSGSSRSPSGPDRALQSWSPPLRGWRPVVGWSPGRTAAGSSRRASAAGARARRPGVSVPIEPIGSAPVRAIGRDQHVEFFVGVAERLLAQHNPVLRHPDVVSRAAARRAWIKPCLEPLLRTAARRPARP